MKVLKRYLVAVAAVAFVAFLIGCGGSSNKATNPPPTPPDVPEEEVTPTPKVDYGEPAQQESGSSSGYWE